jgi:hypothetical protein
MALTPEEQARKTIDAADARLTHRSHSAAGSLKETVLAMWKYVLAWIPMVFTLQRHLYLTRE